MKIAETIFFSDLIMIYLPLQFMYLFNKTHQHYPSPDNEVQYHSWI